MSRKINDEFTDLPVSPQHKTILRRKRDGLCVTCGSPRHLKSKQFCFRHLAMQRERDRRKRGRIKRHMGSASYLNDRHPLYAQAVKLRADGLTLRQIGVIFGMSMQGVQYILKSGEAGP